MAFGAIETVSFEPGRSLSPLTDLSIAMLRSIGILC